MILRAVDLLVTLKVVVAGTLKTQDLATQLGLGLGEVHMALQHAIASRLLARLPRRKPSGRGRPAYQVIPNLMSIRELVLHGVKYVFVPERGKMTRGMPTIAGAGPLRELILGSDLVPVWPDARGEVRGESFSPLHPSAVAASRRDPALYELLTLVDAIRGGSARERELASTLIAQRLADGQ